MLILVVDLTHGGVKIATEFSKNPSNEVLAWDIYHTLREPPKKVLREAGVQLVDEDFIKGVNFNKSGLKDVNLDEIDFKSFNINENGFKDKESSARYKGKELKLVAPVHCKLEYPVHLTHHEAVASLMKDRIKVPMIEVTGVKGKTSVVRMLQEIFKDSNPLTLSSLGVEVIEDRKRKLLKQDISITPASIIEAWEMASGYPDVGIFIFETSLGGTGLADVGVLTNIAEDYTIAGGSRKASQAKTQIFKNKMVVCDFHSFHKFYSKFKEKTNTFSIEEKSNLGASDIRWGLHKTDFRVELSGLKTVAGTVLDDSLEISTFAPAPHHVLNVLSAIGASLTMGASINQVKAGLENFKGLKGRTSIRNQDEICIIEEINPGINVTSIKKALEMFKDFSQGVVIFGGKYGVTCEEISEESAVEVLNQLEEDIQLILVDELGLAIKNRMGRNLTHRKTLEEALDSAKECGCRNVLLIYRSNYPDLQRR